VEILNDVLRLSIACGVKGGKQGTVFVSRCTTESFRCEREIRATQLPTTATLSNLRAIDRVEVGPHGRVNAASARMGIGRVREVPLAWRIGVGLDARQIVLVLLCDRSGQNLFDVMAILKVTYPHLPIIVTGYGMDEETIFKAIGSGAKGYVDTAASPADFMRATRIVSEGSVWAPRRVLSMFIERMSSSAASTLPTGHATFTDREQEVLEMLVGGRSNREIGAPLGMKERTVKAHVAKLMHKIGVQNRIALSVHAVRYSLVSPQKQN
jgi:DNA-binding NarL/FixJ family response regulator